MNDYVEVLQRFLNIMKDLELTIPVAVKKIFESEDMKQLCKMYQNVQNNIQPVIQQFAEALEPYIISIGKIAISIDSYASKFVEGYQVIQNIGKVQYVMWKPLSEKFMVQVRHSCDQDLLNLIYIWLEESNFVEIEETITLLEKMNI